MSKNIDRKAIKKKMAELTAEFEAAKKQAAAHEAAANKHQTEYSKCVDKMNSLKGAYRALSELLGEENPEKGALSETKKK